ncbi:MAG: GFA family protein [Pseudomarimonas sp.]
MIHRGGCHCGRVRFELEAPARIEALDCNCSICAKSGFLHLIVAKTDFRLLNGESDLSEYRWGTGLARHLFCRHCGVKSFYVPRSHPDGIDVNVRCLDSGSIAELVVTPFDGSGDWDAQAAGIAHLA